MRINNITISRIIFTLLLIIFLHACSKNNNLELETSKKRDNAFAIYNEGLEAFKINDFFYASEKFNEAELSFDTPKFSAKSAIMSSYSLYAINLYKEAEENLNRYLKNYPGDSNVIYAHYLLAIIQFEQVGDEKYDLKPLKVKRKNRFF